MAKAKAKGDAPSLLDRLETVERHGRRLRRLVLLLSISTVLAFAVAVVALVAPYNAAIGVWLGDAFGRPEVESKKTIIEAEQFVLRAPDGKARATFGLREENAMGLDLYDAAGHARAGLDLAPDGTGSVWLAASDGQVATALNARGLRVTDTGGESTFLGGSGVTLVDRNQKGRVGLVMKDDDAPSLTLYDREGRNGALLDVSAEGARLGLFFGGAVRAGLGHGHGGSQLNLFGDDGRDHATLTLLPDGGTGLLFHDADGKQRMTLGILGSDAAGMSLFDKAEKQRAGFAVVGDGSPHLELFDGGGTRRGGFLLSPEGLPGLLLEDRGQPRAVLGAAPIDGKTGAGRRPSPSSLLLYDKDGSLVFQAPVY